jgi:2,4-dienoyl-CoA reductase-like NADH-dependent reductase (Old Yellow Enzyme family)
MTGNAAAELVADPQVFGPGRLGPVELRNRVIKAATFEGVTPRGLVTDELIEFHLRPARGGVGMTTVAYCAVSPEGRTDRHQVWMRPEVVLGLRRLAEAVHAEGAAISAQIAHAGPVANPVSNQLAALGPSRLRRGGAPLRAQLPGQLVPEPEAQPAHG